MPRENDPWPSRHLRLKRLTLLGAAILLIGVLIFCHAELRGAQYIEHVNSLLDDLGDRFPDGESDESREWRDKVWDSFFRERWWAYQVIAPLGAGILIGSLLLLGLTTRWRFNTRSLIITTLYIALLIGIPFGILRPRLHQAGLFARLDPPRIHFGQHSSRHGGGPGWSFTLFDRNNVVVTLAAALFAPSLVFLPLPKPKSNSPE